VIRTAGEHALLVETGSLELSHRLDAALRARGPEGIVEIVPGPETVLVVAPGVDQAGLRARLEQVARAERDRAVAGAGEGQPLVTIPVVYDGADLDSVAELAGISVEEVVARHTGRELVVGWLGFAPGTRRARRCPPGRWRWRGRTPRCIRRPPPVGGG
jgi:allophanate hydrolase subunit 1